MISKKFIEAVAEMRRLQKLYFSTRDRSLIGLSKQAEAKVDRMIKAEQDKQGMLFDE